MTAPGSITYLAFWTRYVREVALRHPEWRGIGQPTDRNYLEERAGLRNCLIGPAFKRDGFLGYELVIRSRDAEANHKAFMALWERREAVERTYGRPLVFDPRHGAKRRLVGEYRLGSLDLPGADVDEYIDWFIDCGERLRRVIERYGDVITSYV